MTAHTCRTIVATKQYLSIVELKITWVTESPLRVTPKCHGTSSSIRRELLRWFERAVSSSRGTALPGWKHSLLKFTGYSKYSCLIENRVHRGCDLRFCGSRAQRAEEKIQIKSSDSISADSRRWVGTLIEHAARVPDIHP